MHSEKQEENEPGEIEPALFSANRYRYLLKGFGGNFLIVLLVPEIVIRILKQKMR